MWGALPRGGVYGHAVVKVLLGGTHLDSHTEALVKKSISKDVLQLFDLPEFQRIDNDARESATLLPAVRIVEQLCQKQICHCEKISGALLSIEERTDGNIYST